MERICKHEEKICPACGKHFECRVGNIFNCQCHGIQFTNEAIQYVSTTFDDCLCRACLLEINNKRSQVERLRVE